MRAIRLHRTALPHVSRPEIADRVTDAQNSSGHRFQPVVRWYRDSMSTTQTTPNRPVNTPRQVLFASLIGTTIEFFDFYIYATAAVLVFPSLFFPASDP